MISKEHTERVKKELIEAGITNYGLIKAESRYLPQIIHETEHIGGVVYGQFDGGSAMLIATDHRVIFLDRKPLFTTNDEVTYDVVSGVKLSQGGLFQTVTLHTRIAEYTLRYVNLKCAKKFIKYIEARQLETDFNKSTRLETDSPTTEAPLPFLTEEALIFLKAHDTTVLSSVDRTGNVTGAVVYYIVDQLNRIFILTKQNTSKARNILSHNQVSLTIFEASVAQTLNIQGVAEFETDQKIKDYVFSMVVKPRKYNGIEQLPPVTKLEDGAYSVIRITPVSGKYSDYTKK